jgi:hypothetical protein
MAGGETSLSGNDDSSLPLAYTPGYEQLYINGVLQVRGGDYTATTGTTVTGLTALVANDVVEIFSAVARTVADVYTQTQSDARFVNRNVGGLNIVVPTSVANATLLSGGKITFSSVPDISINGCFTSLYDWYRIIVDFTSTSANGQNAIQLLLSGSPATSGYASAGVGLNSAGSASNNANEGLTDMRWGAKSTSGTMTMDVINPFISTATKFTGNNINVASSSPFASTSVFTGVHTTATAYDGIKFFNYNASGGPSVNASGTIRIYGYNNGA